MTPRRDPVPRARRPWNWLLGTLLLGVLGGGLIAAAVVLWENIDVGRVIPELAPEPPPLPVAGPPSPPAVAGGPFTVVLYRSSRNAAYFPDPDYHPRELERWRSWATAGGGTVREVSSPDSLDGLSADELLLVPEAPCLSGRERAAIDAHLRRSGGVVANWAVGARDADCDWLGWGTVGRLTGAEAVREIPSREALFFTIPDGLPVSPGIDPGTRIELRPDPSLALRRPGPRAFWSDWALNPSPDESGGGADAALALHRHERGGRVAWFGFRAGQAVTPRDSILLARVVQNGIRWAAGRVTAAPSPWPDAHRSAALFTMDVEDAPANAVPVAELLREEEIPGTFFVVSRIAAEDAGLAGILTGAGEVGSHTSDHTPLVGLPGREQALRLRRSVRELEDWSGAEVLGLRPPEETFDDATLEAWRGTGGEYLVATNQARSASPEVHDVSAGVVVVLPRLLKDDYNVFVQDRALRARRLEGAFLEGARKLRTLGGIVVLTGHSQILDSPARLDALRNVADTLRSDGDWWITSGARAARWWRSRDGLEITPGVAEVDSAPADTLGTAPPPTFRIEAPAEEGIDGLWIDVVLPDGSEGWDAFVDGRAVEVELTSWGLRAAVGSLEPGEARTLRLERRPPGGDPS